MEAYRSDGAEGGLGWTQGCRMAGPKGTELTSVQEKGEDMTLEVEFYGVEAWLGLLRGDPWILG